MEGLYRKDNEDHSMGTLRQTIVEGYGPEAWALLSVEESTAAAVRAAIGTAAMSSDEIIVDMPFEQLQLTMASAQFADSCEECVMVARMIHWMIRRPDIFPITGPPSSANISLLS